VRKPDLRPTSFADVALEKGLTSPQGGDRNVWQAAVSRLPPAPVTSATSELSPNRPLHPQKNFPKRDPHGSSFSHYLVNANSKPAHQRRRGHGNPKRTPLHPTLLFQEKA